MTNRTELGFDPHTGFRFRIRAPQSDVVDPILLLHGLTGDENVMWILEAALPEASLVVAPRAPIDYIDGGWSWVSNPVEMGEQLSDYRQSAEMLEDWLPTLFAEHPLVDDRPIIVGFSQGAAMAFALAVRRVLRPRALAVLSGFLPAGDHGALADLPIFWSHGLKDELVPYERAQMDLARLRSVGARPHVCTADVGHKIGADCVRGLRQWLAEMAGPRG